MRYIGAIWLALTCSCFGARAVSPGVLAKDISTIAKLARDEYEKTVGREVHGIPSPYIVFYDGPIACSTSSSGYCHGTIEADAMGEIWIKLKTEPCLAFTSLAHEYMHLLTFADTGGLSWDKKHENSEIFGANEDTAEFRANARAVAGGMCAERAP